MPPTTLHDPLSQPRPFTRADQSPEAPAPSRIAESSGGIWLGLIVATGVVTRAAGLDGGLWLDEIYGVVDYFRQPLGELLTVFRYDTQHPLYSVLAHLAIAAFGEHAWSARLPAFLFGAGTVPMLYVLGRLVATRREALLASALLAVSYHHVWFSQNARGYTALAFFALVTTHLLIRALREEHAAAWAGFAVAAAMGVFTHLTMVFVVAGQALIAIWFIAAPAAADPGGPYDTRVRARRPDWRWPAAGFSIAAALGLLLYAPILLQVVDFFLHRPSSLRGVSTPGWALLESLRALQIGIGLAGLLAFMMVAASGVWSYARQNRLAFVCFVVPGVVTLAGALAVRGTLYPRFFFFLAGFAMLIAVRGALVIGRWLTARSMESVAARVARGEAIGTALACGMIVVSAASLAINYRLPKQDFVGAMEFVNGRTASGDLVAAVGPAAFVYRNYFAQPWDSIGSAGGFARLRSSGAPVWLLYVFPRYLEARDPELMASITRDCRHTGRFPGTVGGGDVMVCRAEPAAVALVSSGTAAAASPSLPGPHP
ncbi:MAG: glycosyltransferase family 39 protein [Gemmatimonadaceae bacterium]